MPELGGSACHCRLDSDFDKADANTWQTNNRFVAFHNEPRNPFVTGGGRTGLWRSCRARAPLVLTEDAQDWTILTNLPGIGIQVYSGGSPSPTATSTPSVDLAEPTETNLATGCVHLDERDRVESLLDSHHR